MMQILTMKIKCCFCSHVIRNKERHANCQLPKWEAKTKHGVRVVPDLLKTLEEDLKKQPIYQDSPKDSLSDLSLEIELSIPFAPNHDSQDIPQRLQLGEVVHYHPSE
ncbi:uncharacterized protein TNCV_1034101 [Trichonephila clavipes]|nr:uncharacterized protein TNCV_1034101 [Trichonephila clavipes]